MSQDKTVFNLGMTALFLSLVSIFTTVGTKDLHTQEINNNTITEEIAEAENNTVGIEVTFRGKVFEIEPGISFTLEKEKFLERDKVLVMDVSGKTLPKATLDDLKLQVTGEIETLVIADIERDHGLDLDPELYLEYANRPVILATRMILSPDLEDVSANPDQYYSQKIKIEGKVDEIKNDYAFILKEDRSIGGDDLLIINVTGKTIPQLEEKIVVTGMVRPFIKAELERDCNLTGDLDIPKEVEAEYSEKPVLILDSISRSAQDEDYFE